MTETQELMLKDEVWAVRQPANVLAASELYIDSITTIRTLKYHTMQSIELTTFIDSYLSKLEKMSHAVL